MDTQQGKGPRGRTPSRVGTPGHGHAVGQRELGIQGLDTQQGPGRQTPTRVGTRGPAASGRGTLVMETEWERDKNVVGQPVG